ncbi:Propionyl-CoA carboxylase [Taphrina deformans PYCC 5710]|uniref:Propionyl-CoA carboxylase n=1 Tax=Taphrina deformans (strain PYCC 5710 / ATCC 11124 / CBS 356.35 / IMI 108563 / JCM 9778 / NBRC 8474) TaxID=1097556 RepID=R4XBX2_TAPDE|nr:Propionyl-CoA carboxylase [Taphrina deformans PYCC 5710]|eukprot:CCG83304.1 Propionyl-CoA carboxylase [Taphrina deformans PYCC 5710]
MSKRSRRRAGDSWQPTLDRVEQVKKLSQTPPTSSRGYQNQLKNGKLWVRDRIALLVDPGTFSEIGSVTGTPTFSPGSNNLESFVPTNFLSGLARIDSRRVAVAADDFTIRAGHADGALYQKAAYIESLAQSLYIPLVRLVDGSSGGGSVAVYRDLGYTYVPPSTGAGWITMIESLSIIPVCGIILGPAVGLGAAKVSTTHFSVICSDVGSLFNAGPVVVERAGIEEGLTNADLGGPGVVCTNGAIDNFAGTEAECFALVRRFLSYLPSSVLDLPPRVPYTALPPAEREARAAALDTAVPTNRSRGYAIRPIIRNLFDDGSFLELGPAWGSPAIVGFARLRGHAVSVVAFDVESPSLGALTAAAAAKLKRHLELASLFGLPVVQLVDMPGFAIGSRAEREGTMRAGVACIRAYYAASVPIFSVILRKVYGIAGAFLVDHKLPHYRLAWPSGEWGSLPLDGGIEAAFAHDLKLARQTGGQAGHDALLAKLQAEFNVLADPIRTAMSFNIEEIVRPGLTRNVLAEWTELMYGTVLKQRLRQVRARVQQTARM